MVTIIIFLQVDYLHESKACIVLPLSLLQCIEHRRWFRYTSRMQALISKPRAIALAHSKHAIARGFEIFSRVYTYLRTYVRINNYTRTYIPVYRSGIRPAAIMRA